MSRASQYALIWSYEHQHYELHIHGQREQCFHRGDEPAWQSWLDEHTAFAFVGQAGRLSVLKEARSRGAGYWYAYRTQARHTHKRYLGPTARVTFARLEAAAKELSSKLSPAPLQTRHEKLASFAHPAHPTETRREEPGPNASSQDEQRVMLLSPKLSRPRLSTPLVERERLLSELDAVRSHPLTLVSASAGSGKTTALTVAGSIWAIGGHQVSHVQRETGPLRDGAGFLPQEDHQQKDAPVAHEHPGASGDHCRGELKALPESNVEQLRLRNPGPKMTARDAEAIGLINKVVPDAELADATRTFAMEIAERGSFALAGIKAAFNARHGGVAGLSRISHDLLLPGYMRSQESKELSAAFTERRKPDTDKFGH